MNSSGGGQIARQRGRHVARPRADPSSTNSDQIATAAPPDARAQQGRYRRCALTPHRASGTVTRAARARLLLFCCEGTPGGGGMRPGGSRGWDPELSAPGPRGPSPRPARLGAPGDRLDLAMLASMLRYAHAAIVTYPARGPWRRLIRKSPRAAPGPAPPRLLCHTDVLMRASPGPPPSPRAHTASATPETLAARQARPGPARPHQVTPGRARPCPTPPMP